MVKQAVVKTGGKQYLVKENDTIVVDKVAAKAKEKISLETLLIFDDKGIELGKPALAKKVEAEVLDHVKGDKIRVARFRAKSRYRRVKGFRSSLTKIKIIKI